MEHSATEEDRPDFFPGECFLCSWGDRFHDGIHAEQLNVLLSILTHYYGRISNADLAQMMHVYFRKRIYDPERMAMLTVETIIEHIEGLHTLDPRITVGEMIRMYKRMLQVMDGQMFTAGGGYDRHAIAAVGNITKVLLALYDRDTTKMNFFDPNLDIDPKRMGAFTNIMPMFTTKRKRRRSVSNRVPRLEERPEKRPRTDRKELTIPSIPMF